MMYDESSLIPISGLQHVLFCPRQCALIHVEQQWEENRFTAEGRVLHERVDRGDSSDKGKIRITYSLQIHSLSLGLSGIADVVEFHPSSENKNSFIPFPVEYKRGKPKKDLTDKVQLCAQAMCLEEMLCVPVPAGALFYGQPRRREDVVFDEYLRNETRKAAESFHRLVDSGITPQPVYEKKKCDSCSFLEKCMPLVIGKKRSALKWLEKAVFEGGKNFEEAS